MQRFLLSLLLLYSVQAVAQNAGIPPPVIIDYFYEPGCPDCEKVKRHVLPELEQRFEGFYELRRHPTGIESNIVRLMAYQDALGGADNAPVSMYVDYQHLFSGVQAIKEGLFPCLDQSVVARLEPDWVPPSPIEIPDRAGAVELAAATLDTFTAWMVAGAGLIDGLNPCAISTLVFFMSLLAVAKVRGTALLMMGIAFCLASFATYTALGFGLLGALHRLQGFEVAQSLLETVMLVLLGLFAFLSFRDAYRFGLSGHAGDVTLRLSDAMQQRIHAVMRWGVSKRQHSKSPDAAQGRARQRLGLLVLAGIAIGTVVTLLESVCTGQVYVPTLVMVIRSAGSATKAWSYLLLYNLMFIVPLATVFLLTLLGLRTERLLSWSTKHVVISKILLGTFFLLMAAVIGAM
jgi:hypothetical protein